LFSRSKEMTLGLVLMAMAALVLASCGTDDDAAQSTSAERAFLEAMVPHHESAVEMARIAQRRAEHPRVSELADAIVSIQATEIAQLERIHERLYGEDLRPDAGAHEELGLSAEQAGMMHGVRAAASLETAEPFDRAFIDQMVPHHRGAIRMARAVRGQADDAELRALADEIISAQAQDIAQMTRWRAAWYGSASTAGRPEADGSAGRQGTEGEGMGHEGH
jgi:uncharacterized protein (DUF305 family)